MLPNPWCCEKCLGARLARHRVYRFCTSTIVIEDPDSASLFFDTNVSGEVFDDIKVVYDVRMPSFLFCDSVCAPGSFRNRL